jgi:hypothetical protein
VVSGAVRPEQVRRRPVDRKRNPVAGLERAGANILSGDGATISKLRIDEAAFAQALD